MYRSFILGLLLSFAIMISVGYWLTSGRDVKDDTSRPSVTTEVSPPVPDARPERPTVASARGALRGKLPVEIRAPALDRLVVKRLGDDPDLEQAITSAVRVGEDTPTGMVDKERIRTAIKSVKPLVKQCFHDVQQRYPPPQKVVLSFTLRGSELADGKLVESTIADPMVEACVLDSLLDARLTAPDDAEAITLTYPFRFEQDAG